MNWKDGFVSKSDVKQLNTPVSQPTYLEEKNIYSLFSLRLSFQMLDAH